LEHKGVRVTLVTTYSISKTIYKEATSIALETISDGYDDGGIE
jgi:pathogen-inducible salicylic acid glucosyltransferase